MTINFDKRNYRKHSSKNKDLINKSLKECGAGRSIVIDNEDNIIAGNGIYEQAQKLGLKTKVIETDGSELVVVKRTDLATDDDKRKQLAVMDNSTSDSSEFDIELLNEDFEVETLQDWGLDVDFQVEDKEIIEDEVPDIVDTRCKLGDIWQLGEHRLMCGDSTKIDDVEKLMNGEKADMVFTDPPYNVDYSNIDRPKPSKKDLGKIKNDKMNDEAFYSFLANVYKNLDLSTKDDASFYIWYADKTTIPFYLALSETTIQFNQMLIWKKPLLLGRNRYQYSYEPCIFGVKGSPYFTDDRTKTTVWDFGGYDKSKNVHPTQKPVFLPSEALKNSTETNDLVLDLFGGSGSTLIACEQLNRKCYTMELDEHYCDVIIQRWENLTGKKAELING